MFALARLLVVAFVVLTIVYICVSLYSRSVRRGKLAAEWDEEGMTGDREALIAAGLAGIEEKLTLQKPFVGDAYQAARLPEIPKTLRAATETMARSKMLKAAFGEDVIDHYLHTARWEQFEYDRRITDWELHRGFERY